MKSKQMCPVPPGSGLKPIYGSGVSTVHELVASSRDRDGVRLRRLESFGDMTYINLFGRKVVMPSTPSAIETLTVNRDRAFANGPAWDFYIGVAFRRGILLMDFEEHRSHRLILQQAFVRDNLVGYLENMQSLVAERVAAMAPPSGRVALAHEFKAITLDIALEVFAGVRLPAEEAQRLNKAFFDCLSGLSALVRKPVPGGKWKRARRGRRVLEEFFYSQLPNKRRNESRDLFSVLCHVQSDDGERFTDDEVVNHMIFVLFAAHDTSTTAVSNMAYHMAKDPQWQERARAESLDVPAELGYDDLKNLPALDLIFRESLRLNSPVPMLARAALKDTSLDGYYIPKGTFVIAEPQSVHSNPKVWKDPYRFDPERFMPERAEDKVHRFAWVPFGGGVHKCIGLYFAQMEIKTILHNMLRTYEWAVPDSYTWKVALDTLGEPVDGLPAVLRRR